MLSLIVNLFFLLPLVALGLYCSYTDIKYKKIFNKAIFFGMVYVFFLYFFFFFILGEKIYITNLLLNGIKVFLVGYFLWYLRFWSAGDAKLFTLYSLLIPLNFYSKSYVSYFPAFNLFMNLFIPLLLFLIITAILEEAKNLLKVKKFQKRKENSFFYKSNREFYCFSQTYLNFLFFVIVFQVIIFLLSKNSTANNLIQNPFVVFIILIIFSQFFVLQKRKRRWVKKMPFIIVSVYLIYSLFCGEIDYLWKTLSMTLFFTVLINVTKATLNKHVQKKEVKKVPLGEIKEGMIVTNKTFFIVFSILKNKLGKLRGDGLSKEQVLAIKNFFNNNQKIEIRVYQTLPFAPFILFAASISILTKSSFYEIITPIFRYFEYLFKI
jgi:Flp pilus assembly protein protease CpaA